MMNGQSFLPAEVIDLGIYLQSLGYQIPADYAELVFKLMGDAPFNETNLTLAACEPLLKTVMVKSQLEARYFHQDFADFLQRRKSLKAAHDRYQNQLREEERQHQEFALQLAEISRTKQALLGKELNAAEMVAASSRLASQIQQGLKAVQADYELVFGKCPEYELLQNMAVIAATGSPRQKAALAEKQDSLRKILRGGMKTVMSTADPLAMLDVIAKQVKLLDQFQQKRRRLARQIAENDARRMEILTQEHKLADSVKQAKQEMDNLLSGLTGKSISQRAIVKTQSRHSRNVFNEGRCGVLSLGQGNALLDKSFNSLSLSEQEEIRDYLLKNARKLKTRFLRRIRTRQKQRLDVAEICKKACRTEGIPIELAYVKPRRSKSKIVMLLDVSGSCRQASEMMLTFMFFMKDVFAGGCKSFAFVNSLFDISKLFDQPNADKALHKVLNTIPTHGVYSDYGRPLRELRQEYLAEFTRETIVIWIGDARNNFRPTEAETFKTISRRAKKTYWLNPEQTNKWNTGDSVLAEYAQYADEVFCVRRPRDLLNFIDAI